MMTITQDQAQKRFLVLPPSLQDAIFSIQISEVIDQIAKVNHLDDRKADALSNVVGLVLLGFLHPEDVKREIEAAGVPSQAALDIANSAAAKIFKALGPDLDKSYAPLPHPDKPGVLDGENTEGSGPIVVKVPPLDLSKLGNAPIAPANPMAPKAPSAIPTANTAPKPSSMSDVGWSKTQSSGPVVKLDTSLVPPKNPAAIAKPSAAAVPTTSNASTTAHSTVGEFERISMMKKDPAAPSAPAGTASAPAEPAPFMLHHDTTFTASAAQGNASFTLDKADSAQVAMPTAKPAPAIPRPAVTEFGTSGTKAPTAPSSGVTHYTDFKPSLASVPTATSGPRNVTQIVPPTPPAPAAPAVPQVPPPPKPPAPPTPSQNNGSAPQGNVIVKNFP